MGGLEIYNSKGESSFAIVIPVENHDHGSTPYFCNNHGSTLILKMAKKCRTLMEKRTVPLGSSHQEVLNPYKICQILTKWKFGPPAKFMVPPA